MMTICTIMHLMWCLYADGATC